MNLALQAFEAYQGLSPTDEQLVFRDVMKRLCTPVIRNTCILTTQRDIKPNKEYLETFDLENEKVVDNIFELEKRVIFILGKVGILRNPTKFHKPSSLMKIIFKFLPTISEIYFNKRFLLLKNIFANNEVDWGFTFESVNSDEFFKLNSLIQKTRLFS